MLLVHDGVIHAPGNGEGGNVLTGAARARARSALYDALPRMASEEAAGAYATQLEACAVAYSGHNYAAYNSMMSRIVFNVKSNGDHIVAAYPVSRVCRLSHKRLRADTVHAQRDAEVELRTQRLLARAEAAAESASATASTVHTSLHCPRCKGTDGITRLSAQLRRGDEGMTTQCICRCGERWKMAS